MTDILREIAFDTETTGLDPLGGDRIIELGAVELVNHIPTGNTFRVLVNPQMPVSKDTVRITGITDEHLKDAPHFAEDEVVSAFLEFVGEANLVAHNAGFDRGFLNMELERCGRPIIPDERWIDTLAIARQKFPGAPASLDALCKRFDISLDARQFHGALLDSQLLARVYLELLGGQARTFAFEAAESEAISADKTPARQRPAPLCSLITPDEQAAHEAFIAALGEDAIWKKCL